MNTGSLFLWNLHISGAEAHKMIQVKIANIRKSIWQVQSTYYGGDKA